MKNPKKLSLIAAVILYPVGLLIGLALSGWYVWGEVEAALFVSRTGEVTLTTLKCPLILGTAETGTVSASFGNPSPEVIHPTIQAQISHGSLPRTEQTVLTLTPGEVKPVQWQVGAPDRVFGGLILVNVYQSSQKDFPSGQGSCGILLSPVGRISGKTLFVLMFVAALALMGAGLALWYRANSPLRGMIQNATNAVTALAVVAGISMLLIFPRWWVLSGFFFFAAIMLIGIILTQFILFPEGTPMSRPPS
jgi:hypothetical protein